MKTFEAGKEPIEAWGGESRDWVFDLLEHPRYRERLEVLAGLDLTRRVGCEPCLRALVLDEWNYEALYHLGWCESCRRASFAVGMDTSPKSSSSPLRRRALLVALAAGLAIAAPIAATQLIGSGNGPRGGVAEPVRTTPATSTSTTPGTTTAPGTTTSTPTTTSTSPGTVTTTPRTHKPPVKPVPRSRPARAHGAHGAQALPETT